MPRRPADGQLVFPFSSLFHPVRHLQDLSCEVVSWAPQGGVKGPDRRLIVHSDSERGGFTAMVFGADEVHAEKDHHQFRLVHTPIKFHNLQIEYHAAVLSGARYLTSESDHEYVFHSSKLRRVSQK